MCAKILQIGLAINATTQLKQFSHSYQKWILYSVWGLKLSADKAKPFDERVLEHIKTLRQEFPELVISADGGVSMETAPRIIDAGADRLVVGLLFLIL
jgi:pentose-5-phosphate-3-epimerase